jgi:hypothetical protein
VVMVHIPSMKLQDELVTSHEPLILVPSVSATATKQLLVPGADCRDIVNADEGRQFNGAPLHLQPHNFHQGLSGFASWSESGGDACSLLG